MRFSLREGIRQVKKKMKKREKTPQTGHKRNKKVVIVGVGNDLKGDDGIGIHVAKSFRPHKGIELMVVATDIPENWIYKITMFRPDVMVIVDSADFGKMPGNFRILGESELSGFVTSTHNIPLKIFLKEVKKSCSPRTYFIGIQPKNLEFGKGLSREVRNSIDRVGNVIKELIEKNNGR